MKYYVWELNKKRKEIIFNKSEDQMGDMEALTEVQFNNLVNQHPDFKTVDLDLYKIQVFNRISSQHPNGKAGLVEMLMKDFLNM